MVESKSFYNTIEQSNEVNPPFVPVQAMDILHLEAVPVPTAPSYLYDEKPAVPSVITTAQQEHAEEPSHIIMMEDDEEQNPERNLKVGAGIASGVIGL